MEEIRVVDHISEYDEMVGAETLHPLVNVIHFAQLPPIRPYRMRRLGGFYAIYLKGPQYTKLHYGQTTYNYKEGALVFFAPGQVVGSEDDGIYRQMEGHALLFHPDLLKGTPLAQAMSQYSYFAYDVNEALLPTEKEKQLFVEILGRIEDELRQGDEHSIPIILDYIKLILDYCVRFYHRQFAARKVQNEDVLAQFERLIETYFAEGTPLREGVLTVKYCADRLHLSPNYFNDLIHRTTGISALKFIHRKMLAQAQTLLSATPKRVNEIAYELGFSQSQNFSNWFRKNAGCTPNQFRNMIKR